MSDFINDLAKRLTRFDPRRITVERRREASVLISMFVLDDEPAFLLTKRSENLAVYSGHISFPGGMREGDDASQVDTALRETGEELGIENRRIRVLGEFHDYLSNDGVVVHTVLGFLEDVRELRPHPDEVEYLLRVPLSFFTGRPPRTEEWERGGERFEVYFYDFEGEVIWGLTARMIKNLVDQLI